MAKVCINTSFGGFRIDSKIIKMYSDIKGLNAKPFGYNHDTDSYVPYDGSEEDYYVNWFVNGDTNTEPLLNWKVDRTDPVLIQVLESLMDEKGYYGSIKVVEIPDDVEYYIHDYDGVESIHENHRVWR